MPLHKKSDELSNQDQGIIKAVEAGGRYKFIGWDTQDFCTLDLVFEDYESPRTHLGMTITIYPVDPNAI